MVVVSHHYINLIILKFKTLTDTNEKLKKGLKCYISKTQGTKIKILKYNVSKRNNCEV